MATRKLGRGVALVGAGMSKFGAFPGKTTRDLFVEAFQEMRASVDKGLDPRDIEALFIGNYSSDLFEKQGHTAPIMADWVGLAPRPATRVEDACASSGVAFRQGIIAVASGLYDIVLAGGIEKMTDLPTEQVTDALATAGDVLYEIPAGFTFPGFYAAMATAYMARYGATPETLMRVGLKNHDNGALNDKAQYGARIADIMASKKARAKKKGRPVTDWADEMEFLHDDCANPVIAWPLRLFDCSPISDGAAALLLVGEELAKSFTDDPIYIIGSGQASDVALHDRPDLTTLRAARLAGQQAYEMAGVTPADIKVAEVHDCFTIAEIIATEDLGFFLPGEGYKAVEEGLTARSAARPINTSGGLKSKGHPVGASGAGQVIEIWQQLRGLAGAREVPGDVNLGLTHNVGGTGQTCVVHIFERRQPVSKYEQRPARADSATQARKPVEGFTGAAFNKYLDQHKLMGSRCQSCDALHMPPRSLCPACYGEEMKWEEMSGKGKLIAFTTVHIAPTDLIEAGYGRDNPYCVGIVQLDENPTISAQILGVDATQPEKITIGTPVRVAFVERGEGEERRIYLAFESE